MVVRILVTGDNHLDNPSTQYGTKKNERQNDFKTNFKVIIDYALEHKVDKLMQISHKFSKVMPIVIE